MFWAGDREGRRTVEGVNLTKRSCKHLCKHHNASSSYNYYMVIKKKFPILPAPKSNSLNTFLGENGLSTKGSPWYSLGGCEKMVLLCGGKVGPCPRHLSVLSDPVFFPTAEAVRIFLCQLSVPLLFTVPLASTLNSSIPRKSGTGVKPC